MWCDLRIATAGSNAFIASGGAALTGPVILLRVGLIRRVAYPAYEANGYLLYKKYLQSGEGQLLPEEG